MNIETGFIMFLLDLDQPSIDTLIEGKVIIYFYMERTLVGRNFYAQLFSIE